MLVIKTRLSTFVVFVKLWQWVLNTYKELLQKLVFSVDGLLDVLRCYRAVLMLLEVGDSCSRFVWKEWGCQLALLLVKGAESHEASCQATSSRWKSGQETSHEAPEGIGRSAGEMFWKGGVVFVLFVAAVVFGSHRSLGPGRPPPNMNSIGSLSRSCFWEQAIMPKHSKIGVLLAKGCVCSHAQCFRQFQNDWEAVGKERARFLQMNPRLKDGVIWIF